MAAVHANANALSAAVDGGMAQQLTAWTAQWSRLQERFETEANDTSKALELQEHSCLAIEALHTVFTQQQSSVTPASSSSGWSALSARASTIARCLRSFVVRHWARSLLSARQPSRLSPIRKRHRHETSPLTALQRCHLDAAAETSLLLLCACHRAEVAAQATRGRRSATTLRGSDGNVVPTPRTDAALRGSLVIALRSDPPRWVRLCRVS